MSTLVVFRLSGVSLPAFLLLRPFFKGIYYCEASDVFRRRLGLIRLLEKFGIRWIRKEYAECSDFERGAFFAEEFAGRIFERIKDSRILSGIAAYFSIPEDFRGKMAVLWKKNLFEVIEPFAYQYAAAVYLAKRQPGRRITILSGNSLSARLRDGREEGIRTVIFSLLSLGPTLRSLWSRLSLLTFFRRGGTSVDPLRMAPVDPGGFKVAFFPHGGIFYAKLFVKDQFYSTDSESPFFPRLILHISLDDDERLDMAAAYGHYAENGIPNLWLRELSTGKKKMLLDFAAFLADGDRRVLRELLASGPDLLILLSKVFFRLSKFTSAVARLKSLKVALVGYDFLFPCELSLALMLKGVRVCATQERLLLAFYPQTYMLFDYYFVAGDVVGKRGLRNSVISHCVSVGLVRVDKLFEYAQKQEPDAKYDSIKKTKRLVLALDYHVPEDDFEDICRPVAKVSQIRSFYSCLILLAREFPSLHIVIKGKLQSSYLSEYISDIVEEIRRMDNLEIELDFDRYNPYFLSEKADFTIACHTSLADELLAAGRAVIFYEATDYLYAMGFDYDGLLRVAKNYAELRRHVQDVLRTPSAEAGEKVRQLLDLYSHCFHGGIRDKILSPLEPLAKGSG